MRTSNLKRWGSVLCGAIALHACGDPRGSQSRGFALEVHVESDPGVALAAARVLHDNTERGRTGDDGKLRLELTGREGETTSVRVVCPDDYRSPDGAIPVALRTLVGRDAVPRYHVMCPPRVRSLVVAVRAQQGNALPVTYRGREIARTDPTGVAHVLLKVPPREQVSLMLDTSGDAQLRPKNPELSLEMPFEDKLVLFDQGFTREAPNARRNSKRAPATGPTPITGSR
jgi:hypothetical protein